MTVFKILVTVWYGNTWLQNRLLSQTTQVAFRAFLRKRRLFTLLPIPKGKFWVPRDQKQVGFYLEGGRERSLGTRLAQ